MDSTSPDTSINFLIGFTIFCLYSLCAFPTFIVFLIGYINKLSSSGSDKGFKLDAFSKLWYRSILITPTGASVITVALITIFIGMSSITFSIVSGVGIFLLILFAAVYLLTQILNIYLFYKSRVLGHELISTGFKLKIVDSNQAIKPTVKINLPGWLGYIVKIRLSVPKRLGGEIRGVSIGRAGEANEFEVNLRKSARGEYLVGPLIVEYTDLLGFTSIQLDSKKENKITVFPTIKKLRSFEWEVTTDKYGEDNQVKRIINADEFYDLQEYRYGDDMRKIHWKMSAKAEKFMLRKPEITFVKSGNFVLLIDNLLPGKYPDTYLNGGFRGVHNILDRMVEIAGAIIDFNLRTNQEIKVFNYISSNKVKLKKYLETRREEWLLDLSKIEWQIKNNVGKYSVFDVVLEKAKSSAGLFIITAESEIERYNYMIEKLQKQGIKANILYVDQTSFLEKQENNQSNKLVRTLSKLSFTEDYLKQFPFFDNLLFTKISENQIEENKFNKIKSAVNNVKNIVKLSGGKNRTFYENTDYISTLEKGL